MIELPSTYATFDPAQYGGSGAAGSPAGALGPNASCGDIHCIQHVVILMLENQSFDRYFGTFPAPAGQPTVDGITFNAQNTPDAKFCLPDPRQTMVPAGQPTLPPQCPYAVATTDPAFPTVQDNPHQASYAQTDIAGATASGGSSPTPMTGFLDSAWAFCTAPTNHGYGQDNPACSTPVAGATWAPWDVMRYDTGQEIPIYWFLAQYSMLQDHLYEPVTSYSLPSHLYTVSNWAATCPISGTPIALTPIGPPVANGGTCYDNAAGPQAISNQVLQGTPQAYPNYAWTDITYLLNNHQLNGTPAPVDWRYYVADHTILNGDCPQAVTPAPGTVLPAGLQTTLAGEVGGAICYPQAQPFNGTLEYWNPLQFFTDVHFDGTVLAGTPTTVPGKGQQGNIELQTQFKLDVQSAALPAVSWVVPGQSFSDHPPASVKETQAFVAWVVNLLSTATCSNGTIDPCQIQWRHTALFVTWDDWGGFYDHVLPPIPQNASGTPDADGYGIRVPGLVIGPYARHCAIDPQAMSFDAYDKFIEDDFLGGQRLDASTDGRPDARNTAQPIPRETAMPTSTPSQESDLVNDFNFSRTTFATLPTLPAYPTQGAELPTPDSSYCTG